MNVLYCKWGSICEKGIDNGLVALGHHITRMTDSFETVDYDTIYATKLSNTLQKSHYDFVISVTYIPIISRVCNIHKIPYISWIVDSPSFSLYSKTIKNAWNRIFIFDRDLFNKFYPENPTCIFHMPLACDIDTWDSIIPSDSERNMYSCDISFIGSLYSEKCRYNSIAEQLPDYMQGYINGLIAAQENIFGYNLIRDSITNDFATEFKTYADWIPLAEDYTEDTKDIVSDTYIGYKCTEQDRIRTLNALAKNHQVHLYTKSDTSLLENVICKGPADSNNMMPQIMKCSKINLNLTNKPISSGLPLRIFDILGSGGFLISNYQPEISELFIPDVDLVMYDSLPDLLNKVDYYLSHDDERIAIAKNGHDKVKSYHSYTTRLQELLILSI